MNSLMFCIAICFVYEVKLDTKTQMNSFVFFYRNLFSIWAQ